MIGETKIKQFLEENFGFFIRRIQTRMSIRHFNKLGNNLIGLEIGVDKGDNAKVLLRELSLKKLLLVDTNFKPEAETLIEDKRTIFYYGDSDWVSKILKVKLDFAYIDGDHSYKQVKRDIENYWKLLRRGGILAGHDINQSEVFKAVSEFAVKNNLNVEVDWQDWVIKK